MNNGSDDITLCKSSNDNDSNFTEKTDANIWVNYCKDRLRSSGKVFTLPSKYIFDGNKVILQHKNNYKVSSTSANNIQEYGAITKKKRIRWTQELHKRFIKCVDYLGGSKKATPKEILKLMNCDGLTIFHVKSHLQKYRVTKGTPESTKGETCSCSTPKLDSEMGIHIVEALRLQLDVQRRLHEQIQGQRILQLRIEEQAKQLQEMLDHQMETKSQ